MRLVYHRSRRLGLRRMGPAARMDIQDVSTLAIFAGMHPPPAESASASPALCCGVCGKTTRMLARARLNWHKRRHEELPVDAAHCTRVAKIPGGVHAESN